MEYLYNNNDAISSRRSTGQRPNAGGKLTGECTVAAVSGQPYAVPAEARAALIGQE
jgi:hypothetical protein